MPDVPNCYVISDRDALDDTWPVENASGTYELLEGTGEGRHARILRLTEDSAGGMQAALFQVTTTEVTRFSYDWNVCVYVFEGAGEMRLDSGEVVQLRPGTFASFRKGTSGTYTCEPGYKELFVATS